MVEADVQCSMCNCATAAQTTRVTRQLFGTWFGKRQCRLHHYNNTDYDTTDYDDKSNDNANSSNANSSKQANMQRQRQ
jgi:hypothetical protein